MDENEEHAKSACFGLFEDAVTRTLIIDDDCALFNLLSAYLADEGFFCGHAPDAEQGLAKLTDSAWDMVILDVMLPGRDGFSVLKSIREDQATTRLPILMLTARGDEADRVAGLEMGSDDYLAKPFSPKELTARLKALRRRARINAPRIEKAGEWLHLGDIIVDRRLMTATVDGASIPLTVSETRLLEQFAATPGEVVARDTLCRRILGHPPFSQDRSLDMLVSRLRKKLGTRRDGGERIRSVRGEGYVWLHSGARAP